MKVKAVYFGLQDNGEYYVNVRGAKRTGNIGDAGMIRRFATEKEAKDYVKAVNATGVDVFEMKEVQHTLPVRHTGDNFVKSA